MGTVGQGGQLQSNSILQPTCAELLKLPESTAQVLCPYQHFSVLHVLLHNTSHRRDCRVAQACVLVDMVCIEQMSDFPQPQQKLLTDSRYV